MIEKMVVKKRTIRERTPARRGVERNHPQTEQTANVMTQAGAAEAHAVQPAGTVRPQAN